MTTTLLRRLVLGLRREVFDETDELDDLLADAKALQRQREALLQRLLVFAEGLP